MYTFSMKPAMLLVSTILVVLLSNDVYCQTDFIRRTSEEDCQLCCAQVQQVTGVNLDVARCNAPGCRRIIAEDQLCSDLFPNTDLDDLQRLSCEVGRDMFTSGITSLLDEAQLFECNRGQLVPLDLVSPDPNDIDISANQCQDCCDGANEIDGGGANEPDDFGIAACRNSCSSQNVEDCFLPEGHRERTGCLLALDFLEQGIGLLDNVIAVCDNGDISFEAITAFPTVSPTEGADEDDIENEAGDDDNLVAGVVVGSGVVVMALLALVVYLSRRRTQVVVVDSEGNMLVSVKNGGVIQIDDAASGSLKYEHTLGRSRELDDDEMSSDLPGSQMNKKGSFKTAGFNKPTHYYLSEPPKPENAMVSVWEDVRTEKAPSF